MPCTTLKLQSSSSQPLKLCNDNTEKGNMTGAIESAVTFPVSLKLCSRCYSSNYKSQGILFQRNNSNSMSILTDNARGLKTLTISYKKDMSLDDVISQLESIINEYKPKVEEIKTAEVERFQAKINDLINSMPTAENFIEKLTNYREDDYRKEYKNPQFLSEFLDSQRSYTESTPAYWLNMHVHGLHNSKNIDFIRDYNHAVKILEKLKSIQS